jgi:predicted transcriptional regulator
MLQAREGTALRKFLVSLSDVNLDRSTFRPFADLDRELDWRTGANYLTRLRLLLDRIPPVERDVIELYYFHDKRQDVIARMLHLSQQAVSHRLHSAYRRITFLLEQPEVSAPQMQRDLTALLPNTFTVRVFCDFAVTSSQTVTARRLGVPQQRICWHLNAGLKVLRESPSMDAVFYLKYFEDLRQHRNILREVLAGRRKRGDDGEARKFAAYARGAATGYGAVAHPSPRGRPKAAGGSRAAHSGAVE